MENVQEITTWGGLIAKRDKATGRVMRLDGSVAAKGERVPVREQWLIPDPKKKGRIWRAWKRHMAGLGFSFEHRTLVCADFGVPTIRKRFFGVARSDGGTIAWPERTHAPRDKAKALGLLPWVGAHTIIDWSLPVKSIFGRKKPLAEATLRRTARGVMRYVVNSAKPFIVPITHSGGDRVHDIDEPLRTLTTAHRGELSVVAPHIAKYRTGASGADIEEPLPTVTANSFEKRPGGAIPLALVGASLIRTDQQSAAGRNGVNDPGEPLNTLHTSSGLAIAQAELLPFVVDTAHGEGQGRGESEWSVDDPLRTVAASPGKGIVAASLVSMGYGERDGQAPRVLDIEDPAGTQVAGGGKAALVAAFLAQHNNDLRRVGGVNPGREPEEPLATLTVSPQVGIVAATLGELRGTNADGRDIADPLSTVTSGGNHAHLILGFLQKYFGSGGQDQTVADPLSALTAKARHGLVEVVVKGVARYLDDIGMRMLEPEEGAAAHEFPKGSLPDEIEIDGKVRRLTKTEKYHLVGNSVPPRMVRLLAQCNVRRELMVAAE
jgi:DNA (cytosine-5)-methyltransferase 1